MSVELGALYFEFVMKNMREDKTTLTFLILLSILITDLSLVSDIKKWR